MDRKVGNAGADERVGPAAPGQFDQFVGIVASIEVGVRLRPDQPGRGDGPAVDQVLLVLRVPAKDRFGGAEHALVFLIRADVVPPRLNAASETFQHPEPRFRFRFAGQPELGPARLIHGHAFGNEFVPAEQAVDQLARLAVVLESRGVIPRLLVEHHNLRPLADRLVIAKLLSLGGNRAAVHSEPEAMRPAGFARGAIEQVPDFEPARVVPPDPLAIDRIVPILRARDRLAGLLVKLALTIIAVADVVALQAVPIVVRDSIRVRALDDFAEHGRNVFVVIRTVDARDVEAGVPIRLAAGVQGEPIRVRAIKVLMRAIGIHAGEHGQSVLVRGAGEFAVKIAVTERGGAIMQRKLAGIIGNNAAGIDDDALNLRALPVLPPPGDVVSLRVNLRDVRLPPAQGAAIPREHAARTGFGGNRNILRRARGQRDEINTCEHDGGGGAFFEEGAAGFAWLKGRHAVSLCPRAALAPVLTR